jgi:CheY-like chemotaxis protein
MASILVVDDEYPVRALAAHHLRTAGHIAIEADSGLRALNLAREIAFDLIITDLSMPHLDGFGLIASLRQSEKTANLPVLVLTARDDTRAREQQRYLGATAMICKPLDREALLRAVHALVPAPDTVTLPPTQSLAVRALSDPLADEADIAHASTRREWVDTTAPLAALTPNGTTNTSANNFWREVTLTARRAPIARQRPVYDATRFPVVEGYQVEQLIATGSNGALFKALHTATGARHALKVVGFAAQDARLAQETVERFAQEYQLTQRFANPHIICAYAQGFSDDFAYIAMELLEGGSLGQRIAGGLAADRAMELVAHIARALVVLHAQGVVHRDLKPANLLFRADGTLVLADFGASTAQSGKLVATATGFALGTPSYLSPEQAAGRAATAQSDLYALGVIAYEMLTGEKPFRAAHAAEVIMQHRVSAVPRLPEVLAAAQPLIDHLMVKDPADRMAEANQVLRWINGFWRQGGFGRLSDTARQSFLREACPVSANTD